MAKFYVDYRFIVEAKTIFEAGRKVEDFLPESTKDVWYTIMAIYTGKNEYDDVIKNYQSTTPNVIK